jgi:hypothetical protein
MSDNATYRPFGGAAEVTILCRQEIAIWEGEQFAFP